MKLAIFCMMASISISFAQLQRVEPPFWWSGMHQKSLQLMCYGKNLNTYEVSSDNLQITEVLKTSNPNYLFVTIDTKEIKAGSFELHFKEAGKIVFQHTYEFKSRREESELRKGFDSSDVIYLLMPDRFANGNPKIDNHPSTIEKVDRLNKSGRHGGDIQGIIDHLDYLEDLGVTTLWSTPLLLDNEPTYSYHTYAQSDLYQIDPRFGTNEDYQRLADELHKKDMKLIMDYVTNHWGAAHWMIQDLPTKDWIHQWPEGFKRSNYRMTTQFDTNASRIDAKGCMQGWFDNTMPDMNQSNPLFLNYAIQNAIWWIEYANLDGLRVDTYSYNDKEGIALWTKAIMDAYPNLNMVGEVWMHDQAQIAYWQRDSKIAALQDYNSYLPSVMDFTLYDEITQMFNEDEIIWNEGMARAYENFANDFLYPNSHNIMVFMGNHDTQRINEVYQGDIRKYKMALTLIATTRGIPQLYYGDEIGMLGDKEKNGDGDVRKDFPGGWSSDSQSAFIPSSTQGKVKGRTKDQEAFHSLTKKILNWRKSQEVIHKGKLLHYIPFDNVYVYCRYDANKTVMIVINNSITKQPIDVKRFEEGIRTFTRGKDVFTDEIIDVSEDFIVLPKTSLVLELQ